MKKSLAILFLISTFLSFAQKNDFSSTWSITPTIQYGFILKHRPIISQLTYQHIYGFSLDFERNYSIKNSTQKFGISALFFNYKNPIIGNEIGVFPYYKRYFNSKKHLGVRVGVGLGYFTKKFDRANNPQNLFISTSLNGIIHGKLFYEYKNINAGIAFTHASNGAFKMPNLGINVVSISLSKRFDISKLKYTRSWRNDTLHEKGTTGLIFEFNNALREVFPTGTKKYWVSNISVVGFKNLGKIVALTTSLDYFYNRALLKEQEKEHLQNAPNITQLGFALGTEIYLGKVSATIQYGYTFYNPYNFDGKLYSKLGLKYNIYKNFWSGIRLKANGGKADFVEWTLHYKL